jgi:LmbE family N-acetylglucosaminyl deacetylase
MNTAQLGREVRPRLAPVSGHTQAVAEEVAPDLEVTLQPGDRPGGRCALQRLGAQDQTVSLPPAGLDLDHADRMSHGNLDRAAADRPPVPGLGMERASVVRGGRALRVGQEWLAVVRERDPLVVGEGLARTPLPLAVAIPVTEQVGKAPEIRVQGLVGWHAPSVAWVGGAPTSALATIVDVSEIDGIERVLVVVAHPDDCDFGNAATTAKWTDAGVTVSYCIITDGDAGGSDRSITRRQMAEIRRVEQTEAAAAVGVTDITFLGYPDGRLTPTIELRRDITRVIRVKQPQRVITQSPMRNFTRIFASHPDHLAAGEATLCAVYPDSRNPFAHPELLENEGLEPYSVGEVWMSAVAAGSPDVKVVDVTDTADRKLAALRCHRSQYSDWDALEERVRGWLEATAKANGLEPGRLAEQFVVVPTA